MTDAQDNPKNKLTLWEALKDVGWLPLLLMGLGGLSILSLVERAVLHDLTLITPFQMLLSGYHEITGLLGAIVEPPLRPAIDWLNAHWHWRLQLHAVWLPLFVLGMILVMGVVRSAWRGGGKGVAVMGLVIVGFGVLVGSVVSGLVPPDGGWPAQGLMVAAPACTLMFANGIAGAIRSKVWRGRLVIGAAVIYAVVAFVLGAGLALVFGDGAGVLGLGALILVAGISELVIGLRRGNLEFTRSGLATLGGFVAAGLILISNWVVRALS